MGQRGILRLVGNDAQDKTCLVNYAECSLQQPDVNYNPPYGWESYYSVGYDYALNTGCQLQNFSLTVNRESQDFANPPKTCNKYNTNF
jgi:hypothetical protein